MSQQFRFPLAGSYNTRVTETNAISSASGIVGLGVVGVMIVGAPVQSTDKDQRFINCFTETVSNPFTLGRTVYLVKRPGFAAANTPAAGSIGTAILVWTGASSKVMSAFGPTNSTVYDGTTSKGAITGKATAITETVISGNATIVVSSSDNTGWYYDNGATVAVLTKIVSANFPGNNSLTLAGTFAHMDGYAFIMDTTGSVWNSDINSILNWTATSSIPANSYPDAGIGCVRHKTYIMAMGTESVQFFRNVGVGSTGSPLQRVEELTLKVGCVGADAIAQAGETTYWCGSSPQGGLAIHSYGAGYKPISTPEINAILVLAGAANISLTSLKFYGRTFVVVNASSVTFVYCVEENAWHEWNSTVRLWYKCAGVSSGSTQVVYAISNISTSGKVYTINPASLTFQDDSMAFTARIQLSKLGDGDRRTSWNEICIIGDQAPSASPLTISYSDDDYQTYTVLGTVDLSLPRPRILKCGNAIRRAWVLTHSANLAMRLEAITGRSLVR